MTPSDPQDLSSFSMLDLFRLETETQTGTLTEALLSLEQNADTADQLEVLMRAAHSLKGAARMVNLSPMVSLAHAMEDFFIGALEKKQRLSRRQVDVLLGGLDLFNRIAKYPELGKEGWDAAFRAEMDVFLHQLETLEELGGSEPEDSPVVPADVPSPPSGSAPQATISAYDSVTGPGQELSRQFVRVSADTLSQLLGLAGESVVASRWLEGYTTELLQLKRLQQLWGGSFHRLQQILAEADLDDRILDQLNDVQTRENDFRDVLSQRLTELELFDHRLHNLSKRLHQEVLECRMRPFGEVVQGFPRMVRDVAHQLGKNVRLEIRGENTSVDRDILDKVEGPLGQLLRNAVDHGIESPAEREAAGKPAQALIRMEARHSAGLLLIVVTDDGHGIDVERVRNAVADRGLTGAEVAEKLSEAELLEFLFLPGFSMAASVTEISGRGVGLDIVQNVLKEVGGSVRITTELGGGTQFQLQLPLTLSVVRTLLVEIAGESYAFPLNRIAGTLKIPREDVQSIEGRQHFPYNDRYVGLITAHQVLDLPEHATSTENLPIVVLGDANSEYGLVVDRFLGERELTVRTLDPRLGKIQDISSAALLVDQTPVLIIDTDDLLRSIENLISGERPARIWRDEDAGALKSRKRVLVVDDSLTVRELERKLIGSRGYEVEVAVDGTDAWNAVRTGHYDLVVTDVDMPRMDGIELVTLIKNDTRLRETPVMIVSYKDREIDRQRGLDAGADYYLTKGSFHDETLLQAVVDLIGEADE